MSKFGLLYDRLIVDTRHSHSTYYNYVREVLDEMKDDFPENSHWSWQNGLFEDFYKKWFGEINNE